jgi:hypothetical protein
MLFGRLVGLLMMYCGVGLLLYNSDTADYWRWNFDRSSGLWNVGRESVLDYLGQSVGQNFSAALSSGWTAVVLIVLGAVLFWSCRHSPHQAPR